MGVLDRIYEIRRKRPFWERMWVSLALAAAASVLGLLAIGMLEFGSGLVNTLIGGGVVVGVFAGIVRWLLALAALALLLALLVRYAPAEHQPWHLVTRGSSLTIAGWVGVSLLFGLYLRDIADYGSIFGNLATVIIAFEYLYLSAIVLLTGLILDRLAAEPAARPAPARRGPRRSLSARGR
jgi:membrane protein